MIFDPKHKREKKSYLAKWPKSLLFQCDITYHFPIKFSKDFISLVLLLTSMMISNTAFVFSRNEWYCGFFDLRYIFWSVYAKAGTQLFFSFFYLECHSFDSVTIISDFNRTTMKSHDPCDLLKAHFITHKLVGPKVRVSIALHSVHYWVCDPWTINVELKCQVGSNKIMKIGGVVAFLQLMGLVVFTFPK